MPPFHRRRVNGVRVDLAVAGIADHVGRALRPLGMPSLRRILSDESIELGDTLFKPHNLFFRDIDPDAAGWTLPNMRGTGFKGLELSLQCFLLSPTPFYERGHIRHIFYLCFPLRMVAV